MANNRMYLHCKICDEYLFLGKDYGTGFFYNNYQSKEDLKEKINAFYDKHSYCGDNGMPFDVRYENEEYDNLVNVVRCKDCFFHKNNHICIHFSKFGTVETKPDDYCSFGERHA